MHSIFKQWWWKIVGLIFLTIIIIGGLYLPLNPGIINTTPDTVAIGEQVELKIQTYNATFSKEDNHIQAYIKSKKHILQADTAFVIDANQVAAIFTIPYEIDSISLTNTSFDIIVLDEEHGTLTERNAIQVQNTNIEALDMKSVQSATAPTVLKAKKFGFPNREILQESIRNLFFHVPMWFGMVFLLFFSFISSILYLGKNENKFDIYAASAAEGGLLFGTLGIITGMCWATFTWGAPWPNDPKLNGAAIAMLIYIAYAILRKSISDPIRKAKVSAVYNIFAFFIYLAFVFIYPRLTDSLHPGNGGNPAFSNADLDNRLRMFFYPAVMGWSILGFWLVSLKIRYKFAHQKLIEIES
ncbi:MAG: cytochrome c biogenesis protein CcsA [Bacteroidota bacterium]